MRSLLLVAAVCGLATGLSAQALSESFDTSSTLTFPPTGWTVVNTNQPGGGEWTDVNDMPYTVTTSLLGDAAGHDYEYLSGITCDDRLTSPSMNLSIYGTPRVLFESEVAWALWMAHAQPVPNGNGESHLEVSTDGGATWTNAWSEDTTADGLTSEHIDISGSAANQADVRIRFRYYGYDAHAWAVDDVVVENTTPVGPSVVLNGSCPGLMTVGASGLTPGGTAFFVRGQPGSLTLPGGPCSGLTLPGSSPVVLGTATADVFGDASLTGNAPASVCGNIVIFVVDAQTCTVSNSVMP